MKGAGSKGVLRHPGTDEVSVWVKLSPLAVRSMRVAAMEVLTTQVLMSFFHPTGAGTNSGRIVVYSRDENHKRGQIVKGGTGSYANPAVLDFDDRLLDRGDKRGVTWSITLVKSAVTAARLDLAADLLKQGHDIVLIVRNDDLHLHFSTENCRCVQCNPK